VFTTVIPSQKDSVVFIDYHGIRRQPGVVVGEVHRLRVAMTPISRTLITTWFAGSQNTWFCSGAAR